MLGLEPFAVNPLAPIPPHMTVGVSTLLTVGVSTLLMYNHLLQSCTREAPSYCTTAVLHYCSPAATAVLHCSRTGYCSRQGLLLQSGGSSPLCEYPLLCLMLTSVVAMCLGVHSACLLCAWAYRCCWVAD